MSISAIMPELTKAARAVAYNWPSVTTADDIRQDLAVHFLERPGSVDKLMELDSDSRTALIIRVGNQLAKAIRDDFDLFSGRFIYSVNEVKTMLKALGKDRSKSFNAAYADLSYALDALNDNNPDYYEAIKKRYVSGGSPNKDSLSRGLVVLTTNMNRKRVSEEYEYHNGGRFRNNSSARKQTDADYFGVEEVI